MTTALLCRECKKSGSLRFGDRVGGSIGHEPCQGCGKPRIVSEYPLLDSADGDSASHTPGPWYVAFGNVSDADEGFGITSKIDTGRGVVCECWPCSTDLALRQRLRADARLITAAPDLLQAAKTALAILREFRDRCVASSRDTEAALEAAIAIAEPSQC